MGWPFRQELIGRRAALAGHDPRRDIVRIMARVSFVVESELFYGTIPGLKVVEFVRKLPLAITPRAGDRRHAVDVFGGHTRSFPTHLLEALPNVQAPFGLQSMYSVPGRRELRAEIREGSATVCTAGVSCSEEMTLEPKTVDRYEPFAEWELAYTEAEHEPHDVIATATFRHEEQELVRRSPLFFTGENTWRFRFTGEALGRWDVITAGPGALDGCRTSVTVVPAQERQRGFLETDGARWRWSATGEAHVPQLVMSKRLDSYWTNGTVDHESIEREIQEFIVETGFTGFSKSSIGPQWFDITDGSSDTRSYGPDVVPDPRSFAVLEAFLVAAYRAGAHTHLWLWGSDAHRIGWSHHGGPDGVGGEMSRATRRLYRQVAGRLGPIPGWSIGYGYDLEHWTNAAKLQAWYDQLKGELGGWPHPIGARADAGDDRSESDVTRSPLREGRDGIFWTGGDYIGMYDYRVPYQWYRATRAFGEDRSRPVLQEDRFRIRDSDRFFVKDYTPALTRRGLWQSMLAGGVGNIWGNLLPEDDNLGSQPYDNHATAELQGVSFEVEEKEAIAAWSEFWIEDGRFRSDFEPVNHLTDDEPGETIWDERPSGDPVGVAVRSPERRHYVFYRECTDSLRMDLRGMIGTQPAIAVNTITGTRTDLGTIQPRAYEPLDLPEKADWAVGVGDSAG